MTRPSSLPAWLQHEAAGGAALFAAAVIALAIANSSAGESFAHLVETHVTLGIPPLALEKTIGHWINDGLMVIFFFVAGLEIKRELVSGALSTAKQAALPFAAALGGMIVPALFYAAINLGDPEALKGWAIPCATDIAFALGILALLGSRVPPALKVFLLALAIIDDLGAILMIAFFYTVDLSWPALILAAFGTLGLSVLNRAGVTSTWVYLAVGFFIWLCVLKSGVHATLAGVITALSIPASRADDSSPSTIEDLQHALHPWVTFVILPLFALVNAGVSLAGVSFSTLGQGIPLGIIAGLVLGKPIGVFTFSLLAIRSGMADRPAGSTMIHLLGIGALAGIGFTMSLFIGMLAFTDSERVAAVRIAVLTASFCSAILGLALLSMTLKAPRSPTMP